MEQRMDAQEPEADDCGVAQSGCVNAVFYFDESFKGFGLSEGLARGLQVRCGDRCLTQEGMGIGTVAVRKSGLTYFCSTIQREPEAFETIHQLDTVLLIGAGRKPRLWFSRLWNGCHEGFMSLPIAQRFLLGCAEGIRKRFRVKNHFIRIPPIGRVSYEYGVRGSEMAVRCVIPNPEAGSTYCLMNEMGADWFGKGWVNGRAHDSPPSWQELTGSDPIPAFYSEPLGWLFAIKDLTVSQAVSCKLFWGREKSEQLCWAGYTIEISPPIPAPHEIVCTYTLSLTRQFPEAIHE